MRASKNTQVAAILQEEKLRIGLEKSGSKRILTKRCQFQLTSSFASSYFPYRHFFNLEKGIRAASAVLLDPGSRVNVAGHLNVFPGFQQRLIQ
jgi:hypothetical protein